MSTKTTPSRTTLDDLTATIATLRSQIKDLEGELGTREFAIAAGSSGGPKSSVTPHSARAEGGTDLTGRIETLLRVRPFRFDELVAETGASARAVSRAMKALRDADKVHNLGDDDRPRWAWVLGDDVDTATLRMAVEKMISSGPCTLMELVAATGARANRISGVIVQLYRDMGRTILNLGNGHRAEWYMPSTKTEAHRLLQDRGARKH